MAQCKTAVTPLLAHWSYQSFVLSHTKMKCHLELIFFLEYQTQMVGHVTLKNNNNAFSKLCYKPHDDITAPLCKFSKNLTDLSQEKYYNAPANHNSWAPPWKKHGNIAMPVF